MRVLFPPGYFKLHVTTNCKHFACERKKCFRNYKRSKKHFNKSVAVPFAAFQGEKNESLSHDSAPLRALVACSHTHSKLSLRPGPLVGSPWQAVKQTNGADRTARPLRWGEFCSLWRLGRKQTENLIYDGRIFQTAGNKCTQPNKQTKKSLSKTHNYISKIIRAWHHHQSMTGSVKEVSKIRKNESYRGNYQRTVPVNSFHSWLVFDETSGSLPAPFSLSRRL